MVQGCGKEKVVFVSEYSPPPSPRVIQVSDTTDISVKQEQTFIDARSYHTENKISVIQIIEHKQVIQEPAYKAPDIAVIIQAQQDPLVQNEYGEGSVQSRMGVSWGGGTVVINGNFNGGNNWGSVNSRVAQKYITDGRTDTTLCNKRMVIIRK